jgi:hypothetical protein
MMAAVKGKKLVYVSEDLIDKAATVCRMENVSLSKLVEGALVETIKVHELGYSSKQMADLFDVLQANRVLGGLFVPSGVLDYMIEKASKADVAKLEELWCESGMWTGKYLKQKFSSPVESFNHFLQLSRWDLNEIDLKEDITGRVKVRCVSTVMSIEGTRLLEKFINGALVGMGYKLSSSECLKGLIIAQFSR